MHECKWKCAQNNKHILIPVSVDMWGTEGIAVVQECGVHQGVVIREIHQVFQVAEVTMTAPHPVSSAVLVQDKHLTGAEPTLQTQQHMMTTKHIYYEHEISWSQPNATEMFVLT